MKNLEKKSAVKKLFIVESSLNVFGESIRTCEKMYLSLRVTHDKSIQVE